MATKTFSGRVDEDRLAFADMLTTQQYGLSFGQYCGTVLIDAIERAEHLPELDPIDSSKKKVEAASFIRSFSLAAKDRRIGKLSDDEVADLIAQRYIEAT